MTENPHPVRYRLLASAIAGQAVDVQSTSSESAGWSDGTSIFVPPGAQGDERATVVVQAALIGSGSLDAKVTAALVRRPGLARRYLAVEGHRALHTHDALLPMGMRHLVDRDVASRSDSPAASMTLALSPEVLTEAPSAFGEIKPRHLRAAQKNSGDGAATHTRSPRPGSTSMLRELEDGGDETGPALEILSSPVGGGGGLGRLLKKFFGHARTESSGQPGADSPTHWTRHSGRLSRTAVTSTTMARIPDLMARTQPATAVYPEWNHLSRSYRPDWCTVVEVDPVRQELAPFVCPDVHALRRCLGRLGLEFERRHRELQGDDIDLDAVVEAIVERKAGLAPDEAVYVDAVRRRRDLSALVLLDISGSAGEPGLTGAPVHVHQRQAAAALVRALSELGDRTALYGFRSQGRTAVQLVPVKRFAEGLDALAWQKLGGLVPGAYTRLGAAIRHGTAVLERDGATTRKLLIVLSDGLAYDHGYEPAYGAADARRALAEARRGGIGSVCLSVGADADVEVLRRVFGTAAHALMPRVEKLPTLVGPLFQAALRSAEQQRRVFQRRHRTRERLVMERGRP